MVNNLILRSEIDRLPYHTSIFSRAALQILNLCHEKRIVFIRIKCTLKCVLGIWSSEFFRAQNCGPLSPDVFCSIRPVGCKYTLRLNQK